MFYETHSKGMLTWWCQVVIGGCSSASARFRRICYKMITRGSGNGEDVVVGSPTVVAETTAAAFCKRYVEPLSGSP